MANAKKHPYQRTGFWQNKDNQFWNNELYTPKSKEDLNKWANGLYKLKIKQEFETRIK